MIKQLILKQHSYTYYVHITMRRLDPILWGVLEGKIGYSLWHNLHKAVAVIFKYTTSRLVG